MRRSGRTLRGEYDLLLRWLQSPAHAFLDWYLEFVTSYLLSSCRTILRGLSKASAFFLATLAQHPSPHLRALAESLIPILTAQPLLRNFSSERDFTHAAHRWRDRVKGLRIEMDIVPEDERDEDNSGDAENWWTRLSDIVGILEGRESVVLRVCEDLGADWKEVCAAWGIFVDTRMRRQDLP